MATTEPTPDVCGAAGCRSTNQLVAVDIAGKGRRVLCSDCRSDSA